MPRIIWLGVHRLFTGYLKKLRSQQLQRGRKQSHLKDLSVIADWQVGLWEMLVDRLGVTLRTTAVRRDASDEGVLLL